MTPPYSYEQKSTGEGLFQKANKNKVWLWIYFIEKGEIKFDRGLMLLRMSK